MSIDPILPNQRFDVPIGEEEMAELVGCAGALKTISRYLREDTGLAHDHTSEPIIALDWLTDTLSMLVRQIERRHDDASGLTAAKARRSSPGQG